MKTMPVLQALRDPELTFEVTRFLYLEAELLDERRYEEWLDLLADDLQYQVPLRFNVPYADLAEKEQSMPGEDVCWMDEGKDTLAKRVQQIRTGVHWAEEPLSRISHLITNVLVTATEGNEVHARSHFMIYRNRVETEFDILVGRREDVLRKTDDEFQICKRLVLLEQNVLLAKNMTWFF